MAATGRASRLAKIRDAVRRERDHEWLAFAERNRVEAIVAHALIELDGRAAAGGSAAAIHDAAAERMQILVDELDRVAARFTPEGIRVVALKNAGIARGIFPCAGCCPMGDVDTLIDRERFREAHRLILEEGFELASRAPDVEPADLEHGLGSGGTEYRKLVGAHEVWFELQWRAIAGRWIRRDQELETPALLARSVAIPGTEIRLLHPDDNLLQVCLHTAKHTYVRAPGLRLHTDVDRLTAYTPPDWAHVVAEARARTIATPVFFSLALARALLGTAIPDDVLAALAPPRWKRDVVVRWLRRIDVFEPDQRKFRRPDMMVFHALLYDSATGLLASALDTEPARLAEPSGYPQLLRRGVGRMRDLITRYAR
jgi:hypothetical protein